MSAFRAFVAVELSPEIIACLDEVSSRLAEKMPAGALRWVQAENIHLTLKFLGNVSENNIRRLEEILILAAGGSTAFEISVGGLGAFPSSRRPRVIWIGVEAPPPLFTAQRLIDQETAKLGYASEERTFTPHLTLARVARSVPQDEIRQVSQALLDTRVGFLGATVIRYLYLFRSDLHPEGAVYTKVCAAPFRRE